MRVSRAEAMTICLLICLGLMIATYWTSRFGGWSGEGDGTRLTLAAEGVTHEGHLITTNFTYSNGYGYPALLAVLSQVSGVSVQGLQIAGSFWITIVVISAYLVFREMLQSVKMAAAATFLLLVQPDFLFYILRNSHERTTWTFGLLLLWLWVRSGRMKGFGSIAAGVCSVYLLLWAMVANNAYLSSSIIATYVIATVTGLIIKVVAPLLLPKITEELTDRRIRIFPAVGFAFVFIFISYVYQPAGGYYTTLTSLVSRTATFVAGVQPAAQPYRYVASAWLSTSVYLMLTSVQWAIVLASGVAWLRDGVALVRHGNQALSPTRMILWLFYLGYATQLAFGFTADFTGWLGVNTQVRLFTPFALVTSPMAATLLQSSRIARMRAKPALQFAAVSFGCLAITLSIFKMTNDPVFGNQWLFYSPSEQTGFDWVDSHLRDRKVWLDTTTHQLDISQYRKGYDWQPANSYTVGTANNNVDYVLLSELTTFRATRSGLPQPPVSDRNSVYDNGETQLYQRRPLTPFQR